MSSINGFGGDSRSMNGLTTFTGDTIDCDTLNAITVNAEEIYLDGDLLVYPQSVSFNAPFIITGNAGTNASVSDVITTANNLQTHQLTFTIPRGDPGDTTEAEAIANEALSIAEDAEDLAIAATSTASAALVASGIAVTTANNASTSASNANTTANAAQTDADDALSRTAYVRTSSNYTVFTGDNRDVDAIIPIAGGAGVKFFNKVVTVFGVSTFSELRITIGNNGEITQTEGTATLNNLVVNGTTTGVQRLLIDVLDTNSQFCIPFTRDIDIDDITPLNTRMSVDASFNFNPSTNTLSVPNITGTTSKVLATASVLNSNLAIPFLSASTGSVDILTDIVDGITYNPSTNNLTCTTLTGTATKVNVTESATASDFVVPFMSSTSGSAETRCDLSFNFNPFTNTLTVDNLNGKASKVNVTESATASDFVVPFMSSTSGSAETRCDLLFTFNPSTNVLSTPNLKVENILPSSATLNIGDATNTSTINIEGNNGCVINIGVAAFLNTINIGNNYSNVNIKGVADTAIAIFNPMDQMNGVF